MKSWGNAFPIKNIMLVFFSWNFHKLLNLSQHLNWHYYQNVSVDQKMNWKDWFQNFLPVVFIRLHSSDSMFELKEMKTFQRKPVSVAAPFKGIVLCQISPSFIFNSFFLAARATLSLLVGLTEWLFIIILSWWRREGSRLQQSPTKLWNTTEKAFFAWVKKEKLAPHIGQCISAKSFSILDIRKHALKWCVRSLNPCC